MSNGSNLEFSLLLTGSISFFPAYFPSSTDIVRFLGFRSDGVWFKMRPFFILKYHTLLTYALLVYWTLKIFLWN